MIKVQQFMDLQSMLHIPHAVELINKFLTSQHTADTVA